jgi:alpha-D-ribose 1-methylphosphonate 5-triphosphate synthase subunit PhnH
MSGTASIGLALLDTSTPFYVSQLEGLAGYLRFHTGAPESEQAEAQWAFTSADNQGLVDLLLGLSLGSLEYPEAASTLVIQLRQHPQAGGPMGLQGPGIQGRRGFSTLGLPEALWVWRRTQRSRYPLGIDLLFVFEDEVWGLPRSTEILQEDACTSQ